MLIPITVSGVLLGVDVMDWARGRLDALQPRAVVALFGLHLCYLGPLLHVTLGYWPRFVGGAADWRTSLGILGMVDVAGLLLYRLVLAPRPARPPEARRDLAVDRFVVLGALGAGVGMVAMVLVVLGFGGVRAYLHVITADREELTGSGWLLLIAESWPLLILATAVLAGRRWLQRHTFVLLLLLVVFVLVQFVAGGLRGSRANTVWPALIAVGLVHLVIRPVRRRTLAVGMLVLLAFMYVYGFYKTAGTQVLDLATQQTTTSALSAKTGRTMSLLLLEDFGRAGTQGLVVDRLEHGAHLSWGMTYVGDFVKLTPAALVPSPPPDKTEAGTDVLYGAGSYQAGLRSSRIFGLVGEGMLNFGLVGGALTFLPFAVLVRVADRVWAAALNRRNLVVATLAPATISVCLLALGSDFDNVLWLVVKQVAPLTLVVLASRVPVKSATRWLRPAKDASRAQHSIKWHAANSKW